MTFNAYQQYDSQTGATTVYTISFPYLDRDHVVVTLGGVTLTVGTDYTFTSDTQLTFTPAPTGDLVIKRVTPVASSIVDFTSGAALTETDLDRAHLQALYASSETRDTATVDVNTLQKYVDDAALYDLGPEGTPQAWSFTATASQTDYTLSGPTPDSTNDDYFIVTVDGLSKRPGTDFTVSTANVMSLTVGATVGQIVSVRNLGRQRTLNTINDASVTSAKLNSACGVTASGGTTERSFATHFGDVVNVLDYGADATGATNSTAAIQAAIDAAASKTVYFPAGTYIVNSANLEIDDNGARLVGDGVGSKIQLTGYSIKVPASTDTATYEDIRFVDLYMKRTDGGGPVVDLAGDQGSGHKIQATSFTGCKIEGGSIGVDLEGCENVTFDRCRFIDCTKHINAADGTDIPVIHCVISNCWFKGHTYGVYLEGARSVTMRGCYFTGTSANDVVVHDRCRDIEVDSCRFEDSDADPNIILGNDPAGPTNSDGIRVINCLFDHTGSTKNHIIKMQRALNVLIEGCSFYGSQDKDIENVPAATNSTSGFFDNNKTDNALCDTTDANFYERNKEVLFDVMSFVRGTIDFSSGGAGTLASPGNTSIAKGTEEVVNATMTGAQIGDFTWVTLGQSSAFSADLIVTSKCVTADQVEITFNNNSSTSTINLTAETTCRILRISRDTFDEID